MSAEILRRAAAAMRERAEAEATRDWEAVDFNDDPVRPLWGVANDAYFNPSSDDEAPWLAVEVHTGHRATAEHIASWHPAVALAVADWLDAAADHLDVYEDDDLDPALRPHMCPTAIEGLECSVLGQALAVARAYLGEEA